MSKFRSLVEQLRMRGVSGVASILRSNLYHVDPCIRLELDLRATHFEATPPCPADFILHRSSDMNWIDARNTADPALPLDFFEDQIHGLTQAYVGFLAGRLAHISWLAVEGEPTTVARFHLKAREAEIRNVVTLSAFRGRGILGYSAKALAADMKSRGFEKLYAHIAETNTPSLKGFERAGFKRVCSVVIRRILGCDHVQQGNLQSMG